MRTFPYHDLTNENELCSIMISVYALKLDEISRHSLSKVSILAGVNYNETIFPLLKIIRRTIPEYYCWLGKTIVYLAEKNPYLSGWNATVDS